MIRRSELVVTASIAKRDETGLEWIFAAQRADLSPIPEPEQLAPRYHVRDLAHCSNFSRDGLGCVPSAVARA
jgi:hypothetical protein